MLNKANYYFMALLTSAFIVVMLLFSYLIIDEFLSINKMKHVILHDLHKATNIVDKSSVEVSANRVLAKSLQQEGRLHLTDTIHEAYITIGILLITMIAFVLMWVSIFKRLRYVGNIQMNETQLKELLHYTQLRKAKGLIDTKNTFSLNEQDQDSFIKELKAAMDQNQFVLYYQPIINIKTQQIVDVEALLRWQHPVHGLLSPDKFLPLYEITELIIPLGKWILHTAAKQLKAWHQMGYNQLSIAINLSVKQLSDPGLFGLIREVITSNKIPADKIQLEITESIIIDNASAIIPFLNKIKNLGIKLSLDDFGTGYSSLSYLKRFSFDVIKIDKSFVQDMTSDISTIAIVESIVTLAKNLGLLVIAEGVSNPNELAMLKKLKCDYTQGFLYSGPLAAEALTDYLISFGKKVPIDTAVLTDHKPNYQFDVLTNKYAKEAIAVITQAFCNREPMTKYLNIKYEEFIPFATLLVEKAIEEQLSVVALEQGQVKACAIVEDMTNPLDENINIDPKFHIIFTFLAQLGQDFFANRPLEKGQVAHLFITAVSQEAAGHGLSRMINYESIQLAKKRNFEFMCCEFTHPYNKEGTVKEIKNSKLLIRSCQYKDFVYKNTKPFEHLEGEAVAYIWELREGAKLRYQLSHLAKV